MQRNLWASAAAVLVGLSVPAAAAEPGPGVLARGRDVVQACFHRHCEPQCDSCASPCSPCDKDALKIGKLICELDSGCKPCARRRAASRLDDYNWQCHPEIVAALLQAMQSDCDPNVREKAADSLVDMKACSPDVIGALRLTACTDCDKCVRRTAEHGVKKLERCRPPCLTYVSCPSCPASPAGNGPVPNFNMAPAPAPQPMPDNQPRASGSTRLSVRSFFSTAVSKVKSRM